MDRKQHLYSVSLLMSYSVTKSCFAAVFTIKCTFCLCWNILITLKKKLKKNHITWWITLWDRDGVFVSSDCALMSHLSGGRACVVANRATLTHSYIINQTETLSYRDTMRQFIVHAICYHDSTPALMLDGTRRTAHKRTNGSTHTHTHSATYRNTFSFSCALIDS